jgi:uncharacterized membrane protein (UPF0127 family)
MNTLNCAPFKLFCGLVCLALSLSCYADFPKHAQIKTPAGKVIELRLAISMKQKQQGLSGVKKADFPKNHGMLFLYGKASHQSFWMPDTYFDLDIFYLSRKLEILKVHRDVPHHPGRKNPTSIPRVPSEYAHHVLEMRSDSPIAKKLKPGDKLTWSSTPALWQIVRDIRQQQSR